MSTLRGCSSVNNHPCAIILKYGGTEIRIYKVGKTDYAVTTFVPGGVSKVAVGSTPGVGDLVIMIKGNDRVIVLVTFNLKKPPNALCDILYDNYNMYVAAKRPRRFFLCF